MKVTLNQIAQAEELVRQKLRMSIAEMVNKISETDVPGVKRTEGSLSKEPTFTVTLYETERGSDPVKAVYNTPAAQAYIVTDALRDCYTAPAVQAKISKMLEDEYSEGLYDTLPLTDTTLRILKEFLNEGGEPGVKVYG